MTKINGGMEHEGLFFREEIWEVRSLGGSGMVWTKMAEVADRGVLRTHAKVLVVG